MGSNLIEYVLAHKNCSNWLVCCWQSLLQKKKTKQIAHKWPIHIRITHESTWRSWILTEHTLLSGLFGHDSALTQFPQHIFKGYKESHDNMWHFFGTNNNRPNLTSKINSVIKQRNAVIIHQQRQIWNKNLPSQLKPDPAGCGNSHIQT